MEREANKQSQKMFSFVNMAERKKKENIKYTHTSKSSEFVVVVIEDSAVFCLYNNVNSIILFRSLEATTHERNETRDNSVHY